MAPAPKYSPEKQQEIILDAAVNAIRESSVTDFTMAKISRLAGLSMGSIYKFVQSKDDMILALACQACGHMSVIFEKVLSLPITTPQKILAIALIAPKKLQRFEFDYELTSYATNEAVLRRASRLWADRIIEANNGCEQAFKLSMAEGIIANELKEVPNLHEVIEEIIISSWAMTVGYEQVQRVKQTPKIVEQTDSILEPLAIDDPIIRSLTRLLNSYPWLEPINQESIKHIENELIKLDLR